LERVPFFSASFIFTLFGFFFVFFLFFFFVCVLFISHTSFMVLSISSVDLSIMNKKKMPRQRVSEYFHLLYVSARQRKREYCLNLFGSRGEWWKVLFPTPLRTDDGPDRVL